MEQIQQQNHLSMSTSCNKQTKLFLWQCCRFVVAFVVAFGVCGGLVVAGRLVVVVLASSSFVAIVGVKRKQAVEENKSVSRDSTQTWR